MFSLLSFHYLNSLFSKGAKSALEEIDMYNPTPENKAECQGDQIDREWSKELKNKNPGFGAALWIG